MKKIKMLRNVPADPKSGRVAYAERQVVTVDDAIAAKLLNRSRPLAVLIEDVKPSKPVEMVAALEQPKPPPLVITAYPAAPASAEPKPKIEPAKPYGKPSKQ